MPASELRVIETPQTTKKMTQVSQGEGKPNRKKSGVTIAEMEVGPHDDSLMSLGAFAQNDQPTGFSIAFDIRLDSSELVTTEITTKAAAGKLQYLLQITNHSNKALCAEIRQL